MPETIKKEDFTGFEFNGIHSSTLGILRVSDGSRYQENLIPTSEDYTVDIPGGDGQYYFGSNYKTRQFNIQIAFDKITEMGLRKIRQWLGINTTGELIFDEEPYKVYNVKVTGEPNLSYICFLENGKRIYKGEGNINFTAFYPYAHARIHKETNEQYGYSEYTSLGFENTEEWEETSGLLEVSPSIKGYNIYNTNSSGEVIEGYTPSGTIKVYNGGDLEVPFIISILKETAGPFKITFHNNSLNENNSFSIEAKKTTSLAQGENSEDLSTGDSENPITYISLNEDTIVNNPGTIIIDTKKNTIIFKYQSSSSNNEISCYSLLKEGNFFKLLPDYKVQNQSNERAEQILDINIRNFITTAADGSEENDAIIKSISISYDYLYL